MISGFVVDPDRKKMSKSKGNAVVPTEILDKFGADAVRWRAANARPGMDSPFDESQMKVGRRLATKILNASRFILMDREPVEAEKITYDIDRAMLEALKEVVKTATKRFNDYDYSGALEISEAFFWSFCDDYLEVVKERAYGAQGVAAADSANAALQSALSIMLRLLAPILPFVTEEVWSWWQEGSIHHASWPKVDEIITVGDPAMVEDYAAALKAIRGAKSVAKVTMKTEVSKAVFHGSTESINRLQKMESDLRAVGRLVGEIEWLADSDVVDAEVTLVPPSSNPN